MEKESTPSFSSTIIGQALNNNCVILINVYKQIASHDEPNRL